MITIAQVINDTLEEVVEILDQIAHDDGVPKKVKEKIELLIETLKEAGETRLKVNKCLDELDQIAEDVNLQTFIRTQIWNASSMLEKMNT